MMTEYKHTRTHRRRKKGKHLAPKKKVPLRTKLKVIAAAAVLALFVLGLSSRRTPTPGTNLPILMYHHFVLTDAKEDTVVSEERFREQMTALRNAGYTAVTIPQLLDFVDNGAPLPDKPVLITMDDGYTSNLDIAAPILESLGMNATVFVIGINEGEPVYVHSGEPFWQARFSYEEAAPWVEKGIINPQSHTMDMHQLESYGYSGRDGMLPLPGESEEDYRKAIAEDLRQFRQRREGRVASDFTALAYPFGYYSEELDNLLEEEGIAVTLTIDEHCNKLKAGDPSCLRMLGRFNVTDGISGAELVSRLNNAIK